MYPINRSRSTSRRATLADEGAALVMALLAMLLLLGLGLMLVLSTMTEVLVAAGFRAGQEALYAAEAIAERVIDDLAHAPDWNDVLRGTGRSAFVDGLPPGPRTLSDGSIIDLATSTNILNCGHAAACTPAEMDTSTSGRPWGPNNPRWTLYAYGPLSSVVATGTINSNLYVAGWVADDQSETDDDPTRDGDDPGNPGSSVVVVHAEAFGPGGAHQVVAVTIARVDPEAPARGVRQVGWRQRR